MTIEKKSSRKGTKTELSFVQMSPYVSREDPWEGEKTYLTWQDSGDQDPLHGAGCLMDEEVWIYVTEAGARLGLREGRYVISREHEVLAEVPSEIVDFLARDIPVTWLSPA